MKNIKIAIISIIMTIGIILVGLLVMDNGSEVNVSKAAIKRQSQNNERIIIEEDGLLENNLPYQIITDSETGIEYLVVGGWHMGSRYSSAIQELNSLSKNGGNK